MHKIKEVMMDELKKIEDKIARHGAGSPTEREIELLYKMTDIVKNIDKIDMLEDGDYSEATDFMGEGRMYGTSYARGRGRNARRDSMGRYSRDGGMYSETDGMMHHDRMSYARDGRMDGRMSERRGGYSYGDAKHEMMECAEEMMDMAETEEQRRAIEHFKRKIEQA